MNLRARGASLVVATWLVACGVRGPVVPDGATSRESMELLGKAPDFAFSVRVDRLRADPVYGPLVAELADRDIKSLLQTVASLDGVGTLDGAKPNEISAIVNVRAAPDARELPRALRGTFGKEGGTLPNGVRELATLTSEGWPIGLYLTPREWVFVSGRAAGKGHAYFSSHSAAPPPVSFGNDALMAMWIGGEAPRNPLFQARREQPGNRGVTSAELVLRDGSHGDLFVSASYETEEFAEEAVRVTVDRLGMYASVWSRFVKECPGAGVLGVENRRNGRVVKTRITHLPQALTALKACR